MKKIVVDKNSEQFVYMNVSTWDLQTRELPEGLEVTATDDFMDQFLDQYGSKMTIVSGPNHIEE